MKEGFQKLSVTLFNQLSSNDELSLEYSGEDSFFLRFNGGQVRQNSQISDGRLSLTLSSQQRTISGSTPFSGNFEQDLYQAEQMLGHLQKNLPSVPEDPFVSPIENHGQSKTVIEGQLLDKEKVASTILKGGKELDMTGIYAAGKIYRATANSAGTEHWFEVDNFSLDYSLISPTERMAKGNYSGNDWNEEAFLANRNLCAEQLKALAQPAKTIQPGKYRTYLAPGAVAEIIGLLQWRAFSSSALKQRQSPLLLLADGKESLSPLFNFRENFSLGLNTPFNEKGEKSADQIELISKGKLQNTLINQRSAKEYGLQSNGANAGEMLRSPEMDEGDLLDGEILNKLGTGLYLNQLHYLNWSELNAGRLTGMTRYACFWVENGKLIGPIENMRFDDSIFHLFGDQLEALTKSSETLIESGTYDQRHLGGTKNPGALISEMNFAL